MHQDLTKSNKNHNHNHKPMKQMKLNNYVFKKLKKGKGMNWIRLN